MKVCLVALSILLPSMLCSCQQTGAYDTRKGPPIDAMSAAALCRATWSPTQKTISRNGVLCSAIEIIDASSAETFKSLLEADRIDWIVLASLGGDVGSALDMAEAIYDSRASLVINGPCLSSCANYLFLAGRRKYVIPGGIVGWHGGIPDAPQDDTDPAAPLIARSRAFIAKIAVNPDLFEKYPQELEKSPDFVRAVDEGKNPFWTYPRAELEKRFSVGGIVEYWFPSCASWDQEVQKIGVPFLFRAGRCASDSKR